MAALARLSMILAHGGIPGLIDEAGGVLLILVLFGYFIRRSARKEREQDQEETKRSR